MNTLPRPDTGSNSSGSAAGPMPSSDAGISSAPAVTSGRSGKRGSRGQSGSTSFSLTVEEALGIWREDIENLRKAGVVAVIKMMPEPLNCVVVALKNVELVEGRLVLKGPAAETPAEKSAE